MKNLLIFTYLKSLKLWNTSGIISREIALYKEFNKRNVTYSFLTFGTKEDLKFSKYLRKINIIPVREFLNLKFPLLHFIKSLFLPIVFRNEFRESQIIKTNQIYGSWIACVAKLLLRKKIIIRGGFDWLNRHVILSKKNGPKNYLKYWLKYIWIYLIEFFAYKISDCIILTSQSDISFIIKQFNLKKKNRDNDIHHFYNFIDTNLFKPMDLQKKENTILFIGKLMEQKNLFNLLKAFKNLRGFNLDIVGNGPLVNELRDYIEKENLNVKFLGIFPNNKIPEIINQYKILILPSYWEGNPKVLLEAMSCGVACIGTDIPGIKDIIKHKENGYLCKHEPHSISNAVLYLYKDDVLVNKICKNARAFIVKNCSLKSIANKEYQLYKKLLNN